MNEIEQLSLVELPAEPAKRTERQDFILDAVKSAGIDGLLSDEAGALLCERRGRHSRDDRCEWDGQNGKGVLEELKAKDLVYYRRAKRDNPGAWFAVGVAIPVAARPTKPGTVPYNEFPEGY